MADSDIPPLLGDPGTDPDSDIPPLLGDPGTDPDSDIPPLLGDPGTDPDSDIPPLLGDPGTDPDWESCSSSSHSSEPSSSSDDNVYKRYGWHGNGPPNASQVMSLMNMMAMRGLMSMGGLLDSSDDEDGCDVDVVDVDSDEDAYSDGDDESSSSEDDEDMDAEPTASEDGSEDEGSTIVYRSLHHAEFAAAVRKAKRIKSLSLLELVRTVDYSLTWKPDKDIEAVLKVLEAGTGRVLELELGDAEWAGCHEYGARLVRLLEKYRGSLRALSLTSRALVQPNKKHRKEDVMKVVSKMRCLERLEIFYGPVNLHFSTYRGQFNPLDYDGRPKKRTYFSALKSIELHLTPQWFERQFHHVLLPLRDPGLEEYEYEEDCGGDREEERDDMVVEILQHRKDVVTLLDMSCVSETSYRLPIVDMFAELSNLRRIALRVEYLDVTLKMEELEEVKIVFHETTEEKVAAAVGVVVSSDAWCRLHSLSVQVTRVSRAGPRRHVQFHWNRVLIAAAVHCTQLRRLVLTGSGWDGDVLGTLIKNNTQHLEQIDLSECGDLPEDVHLQALLAAPSLRSVKMRRRQLAGQSSSGAFRKRPKVSKSKASSSSASGSGRPAPLSDTEKLCLEVWAKRGVVFEWAARPASA